MQHKFALLTALLLSPLASLHARFAVPVPTALRCEYLENPLGIDIPRPRLSWRLSIRDATERGQRQTAYQVLVASTPEALARETGDRWDSGRVQNDQSIQVEYAGTALASGQECYWKVRVWDAEGRVSPWSDTARWTMGLLQARDWKASRKAESPSRRRPGYSGPACSGPACRLVEPCSTSNPGDTVSSQPEKT
jgi:hypothetical protein